MLRLMADAVFPLLPVLTVAARVIGKGLAGAGGANAGFVTAEDFAEVDAPRVRGTFVGASGAVFLVDARLLLSFEGAEDEDAEVVSVLKADLLLKDAATAATE